MTTLTPDEKRLHDIANDLLDRLGDGAADSIVSALQSEGDSRAAEMRERAAAEADLYDVAIAATIRALPLTASSKGTP